MLSGCHACGIVVYLDIHGSVGHAQGDEGDDEAHGVDEELGVLALQISQLGNQDHTRISRLSRTSLSIFALSNWCLEARRRISCA